MSNEYFKSALADFTVDFASGGAIRVMADKGYTVKEIHDRLDFPVPPEKIGELVWKHYVENGVIRLEEPCKGSEESPKRKVTYEKVQDKYGHTSFRQVEVEDSSFGDTQESADYILCDFGKRIYQNKAKFEKELEALDASDRDYILGLPWPLTNVWHIKNERMERIAAKL